MNNTSNIAIYVDGDNANYKDFEYVYDEIKKIGRVIIRRIYGDWTNSNMKGWKNISMNYGLETSNCFNLPHKNSTDIYLICDILQDLYKNSNIDVYIIVSSDSDYSHVANRIRSEGKIVIGIGRLKTPDILKNACDKFICTEIIKNNECNDENEDDDDEIIVYENNNNNELELDLIIKSFSKKKRLTISKLKKNLTKIYDTKNNYNKDDFRFFEKYLLKKYPQNFKVLEENNSVIIINITNLLNNIKNIFYNINSEEFNLSKIKDNLILMDSSFDQRNYGFKSMKDFIKTIFYNEFELIVKSNNEIYIKQK